MTAQDCYSLILFISAKNKQQGYVSPDDFNLIIRLAQWGMLDYLLGEFQSYQTGRPVAKVEFGMNEVVRQRLTPFIDTPTVLTIDNSGFVAYPTDYEQGDAMFDGTMNRVRYVQQHKLYSYLNSKIDPINTNPIFLIEKNGFRFYPNVNYNGTAFSIAKLSYVATPPDITWAYTLDGNGLPVYDPSNSKDPKWYNVDMMEVIGKALKLLGINLQVSSISQFADQLKAVGQ